MLQPLTHASHRPPALRRSKEYCATEITRLNSCRVLVWSMRKFQVGRESDLLAKKARQVNCCVPNIRKYALPKDLKFKFMLTAEVSFK